VPVRAAGYRAADRSREQAGRRHCQAALVPQGVPHLRVERAGPAPVPLDRLAGKVVYQPAGRIVDHIVVGHPVRSSAHARPALDPASWQKL
jgi:hypothetical protein